MTTEFPSADDAARRDGSALSEGLGAGAGARLYLPPGRQAAAAVCEAVRAGRLQCDGLRDQAGDCHARQALPGSDAVEAAAGSAWRVDADRQHDCGADEGLT